ncbi:MAG: hypothetical protein U0L49_09105 [Eubacterium sp.]|nr:hypothetical protein [Eubacterium sp.]
MANKDKRKGGAGFAVAVTILVLLIAVIIAGIGYLLLYGNIFSTKVDRVETADESVVTGSDFKFSYAASSTEEVEPAAVSTVSEPVEEEPQVNEIPPIDGSQLVSTNAYMIRTSDDAVLLDKGGTDKIYPASMTKIMTAYLACINLTDQSEILTVTQEDIDPGYLTKSQRAGYVAGDTASVQDLEAAALLPSAAEACYTLARRVSGSPDAFVALMNQTAQGLGMTSTNFANPVGFHDENHYTTCADMAILLKAAIQNETFRNIITLKSYTTGATKDFPAGILMYSNMLMNIDQPVLNNGVTVEGGKTGYTDEAAHCLASFAKDAAGTEYILVTAGAAIQGNVEDEGTDTTPHVTDALYIYNQLPAVAAAPADQAAADQAAADQAAADQAAADQAAADQAAADQTAADQAAADQAAADQAAVPTDQAASGQ